LPEYVPDTDDAGAGNAAGKRKRAAAGGKREGAAGSGQGQTTKQVVTPVVTKVPGCGASGCAGSCGVWQLKPRQL
jgi:hypothetical protein